MNLAEMDFRHAWISVTLRALKSGFKITDKIAKANPWFDGTWQLEHAENILGIAFVTAQTYILGTVEDLNMIRKHSGKSRIDKRQYYSCFPKLLSNKISPILLINSIANYYKHRDEWTEGGWAQEWAILPQNKETVKTLKQVGIGSATEFPCYVAATKLWGAKNIENLECLLEIISEWRKHVLSR